MKTVRMIPDPPASLSPAAVAEWQRLAPRLVKTGVLTAETVGVFATYCASYATWMEAQTHPATQETVSKSGNIWKAPSAWFIVGTRAFSAMARAGSMLGLNAAGVARRRKGKKKPGGLDRLLKPRLAE